jgi:fructokinase
MGVVGIGELLWDIFPAGARLGGAPFNLVAHAGRLGHQVAYASAVGRDELGRLALEGASRLGVPTDLIALIPGVPTGTVVVGLDGKGAPEFEIVRPAAYDAIRLTKAEIERVASMRPAAIVFGTLAQTASDVRRSTRALLEACPTALRLYDVNLRKNCWDADLLRELAGWASIIKLNAAEAGVIAPTLDVPSVPFAAFAHSLASRLELRAVCITLGEDGAALWLDGTYAEAGAPEVTVIDTVGAGDAFAAALVDGILKQLPALEVLARANALGALVASKPGAIPDWTMDELHQLVTTTAAP